MLILLLCAWLSLGQCVGNSCPGQQTPTLAGPDFHGGHGGAPFVQPHFVPPINHGGGWGWHPGGWDVPNVLPYIAPIIASDLTSPRLVYNPTTGLSQMMPPGQWLQVQTAAGIQWTWQAYNPPIWPLVSSTMKAPTITTATVSATIAAPASGPIINEIRKLHPIRRVIGGFKRLIHGGGK
jgi:hypothetical protein